MVLRVIRRVSEEVMAVAIVIRLLWYQGDINRFQGILLKFRGDINKFQGVLLEFRGDINRFLGGFIGVSGR